jgi:hypothetical protein
VIVAFRRHTLLPLDDCLYALQATIPHLTRSSLHRCLERHGISRLPEVEGTKPGRKKFERYPIGYFHVDLAEVRTAEGKLYLFVAIDRTSKFRTGSQIGNGAALPPLRYRLRVDSMTTSQRPQALLTMLYRSTNRLCRSGAPV